MLLLLAACAGSGEAPDAEAPGGSFRIREDPGAPLNSDLGWAVPEGQTGVVRADAPFRIRFEVERPGEAAGGADAFGLQVRRNEGTWEDVVARDFPYPDEISSPRVSVVAARGYSGGSPTTDLLSGSTLPFRPGVGVSLDSAAAAGEGSVADGRAAHGEWEWPVVIRRFADGAVTNDEGDAFDFRMRSLGPSGEVRSARARVRLSVPPGLLGGTFVETPGRLGPWQSSDGTLYFVMEPAETDNVLMVVKSTDGGRSWAEVDGARRPATVDLEGVATAVHAGAVHILHQTSDAVVHHVFRSSDAPGGEGWEIRDEPVSTPGEPPVQVAALELRDDGGAVAVYGGPTDLRVRVRSPRGVWGPERRIGGPEGHRVSGPSSVLLPDGRVAVAYTTAPDPVSTGAGPGQEDDAAARPAGPSGGRVWVRVIDRDGIPGPPVAISGGIGTAEEESGALAPLAYLEGPDEVVVLFRRSEGQLWERRLASTGTLSEPVRVTERRVVQNAVDSDQVGADAIVHAGVVHLLFIDEATGDIRHTRRLPSGVWTPDEVVVDGIEGQWVRGAVVARPDGQLAYGFVYDAGSNGGSGMNRYAEVRLVAAEGRPGPQFMDGS